LIAGETKEETASSPLTVTVKDPTPKKSESVFSRLTQGSADRNRSRITVDTGSATSSVQVNEAIRLLQISLAAVA
jgi:hypothetical protein